MTDIQTTVENARAQYHYPPIRTAILPSEGDELQMRLADRLRRHPHQHALEVIADLGRVFDAEDAEPAIEALGRLLVHASLLAGCERMAIAPIILLGRELTRDSQVSNELPLRPAAMLAEAVLDHRQEPAALVRGLAMAIAKAVDDCEIVHELKIDPLALFLIAGREVFDGKPATVVTAPAVQPTQPDKAVQRALAWSELRKASEAVVADELKQVPDGEPVILSQRPPEKCQICGAPGDIQDDDPEVWTCTNGHHVRYCARKAWDPVGDRPINPDVGAAAAMAPGVLRVPGPDDPGFAPLDDAAFARQLAYLNATMASQDAAPAAEARDLNAPVRETARQMADVMRPVSPPLCQLCHAPMSPRPDMPWAWHCPKHP